LCGRARPKHCAEERGRNARALEAELLQADVSND